MPETATYSHIARRPRVASLRTLTWIEQLRFQGCGCSECAWVFNPSRPPAGNSLQEMMENYERQRDKEFAAHVCTAHSERKKTKG